MCKTNLAASVLSAYSPRWMPTVVQPSNLFPIDPNLGPPTTEMSAAFVDHKSVPAAQPYRGAAAGRPSTAQEQAAAHPDVRMELSTLMQRVSALQQQLGDAAGEEHQGVLSEIAAKLAELEKVPPPPPPPPMPAVSPFSSRYRSCVGCRARGAAPSRASSTNGVLRLVLQLCRRGVSRPGCRPAAVRLGQLQDHALTPRGCRSFTLYFFHPTTFWRYR